MKDLIKYISQYDNNYEYVEGSWIAFNKNNFCIEINLNDGEISITYEGKNINQDYLIIEKELLKLIKDVI